MRIAFAIAAVIGVLGAGTLSLALDPYYDEHDQQRYIEQQRYLDNQRVEQRLREPLPSVTTGGHVIEGTVIRIDADSYVLRDSSGRDARVYFDRATRRENVTVGDHIIAQFDRPSAPYASSITRRPAEMTTASPRALPRPQTIEGEVLLINSDHYVIRDLSGREVRLHIDKSTQLDGNLTPGDKVVARVVSPPSDTVPYAKTMYKLNSPQALEGQVVGVEGNTYIVRDTNGREHRIFADNSSMSAGIVGIGDRVVVVRDHAALAHAEAITKR
jgi:uncharacterized protein YdeI (BOF family)